MQHVLPDKAVPQTYKTGIPTIIVGVDPRTGAVVHRPLRRGVRGLVQRGEGHGRVGRAQTRRSATSGRRPPRSTRSLYPHVQWSRDYRTDSGGPGQWRGHLRQPLREGSARRRQGLHVRRRHEVPDAGHLRRQARRAERDDHPLRLRRPVPRRSTPPTGCRSQAGERIMYDYGGGGGWGDPLDRDPQAVLDDVLDEYVSVEGAAPRLRRRAHRLARRPHARDRRRPPPTQLARRRAARPRPEHGLPRRSRRRRHVHRPHLRHARRARSCSTRRRPRSTTSRSA